MLKIGLTGGIASGKSTISQLFLQYDISIIDADIIAHQLVEPDHVAFEQIIHTFGSQILQQDGCLNRSLLRQIIFTDNFAKQQLEEILHPKIAQQLSAQAQQSHSEYCILVVPLLIEASMQNLVDRILVIDLSPEQQLERLRQRDNISSSDAQMMINNQCSQAQRLEEADDVIFNNTNPESLSQSVEKLHLKYLGLAKLSAMSCQ